MKDRSKVIILIFLAALSETFAQISPPGLDDTNTVVWGAFGLSQNLGKRWTTTVYVGASRESKPNTVSPVQRQAILVFNQETLYKFNSHWQLALCTSFRNQNEYEEEEPYAPDDRPIRKEIRYYARMYYRDSFLKKGSIYYAFRPEYRTFFDHSDRWSPVSLEWRFRWKVQASYPLNESKSNQIVVGNELLSTTDHVEGPDGSVRWSHYRFTEDRLTTYFKHTFHKPDVIVNVGVMHQIMTNGGYIAHAAFDVVFQNPFSKKI